MAPAIKVSAYSGKARRPAVARYCMLAVLCTLLGVISYAVWPTPSQSGSSNYSLGPLGEEVAMRPSSGEVAIIITVHGALRYLRECLDSINKHTENVHLILADDCGNATQNAQLARYLSTYPLPHTHLIMGKHAVGYTHTINAGLRKAHDMGFKVMVCLNSDTVLTPYWLESLVGALQSDPKIGMAGPIGNACSFQSVPELTTHDNQWSINPYLPGWQPDSMARLALVVSSGSLIEVPILNGFLMAIKREVLDKIGYMDEHLFPFGFGEENDFALRAGQAGFRRVVVPWVYVYHHKTKSYTLSERKELVSQTDKLLEGKYKEKLKVAVDQLRSSAQLDAVRRTFATTIPVSLQSFQTDMSILFVLNVMLQPAQPLKSFMLHGGWISLVQEALGLARNGAYVRIAVSGWTVPHFAAAFPEANARGIFWGFSGLSEDQAAAEIVATGVVYDFMVATHFSTVRIVTGVTAVYPNIIPAYYVQDIESRFSSDPGEIRASTDSYEQMRKGFIFVKTKWLQTSLHEQFGIQAHLIPPTVDSNLFKHDPAKTAIGNPLHVCAMVRVATPRRNPLQTLQILASIIEQFPGKVKASMFGTTPEMMAQFFTEHHMDVAKVRKVEALGVLGRNELAKLNRQCDVFLDFSSWQAFGRSGLEAMASGCVPILPITGGAVEYAKDGINAFLINTTDPVHAINKLADIVNGKHDLAAMRKAALKTAPRFSMETSSAATASIFRAFQKQWQAARALKLGMRRSLAFTPKETSHQQVMTTPSPVKAPADNSEHVGRKETKVVDKAPVAAVAVKRHF